MMTAWLLTAWIGCQALDMGTTAYALHHGFVEANALTRGQRLYTVKVSLNVGMGLLHRHTEHKRIIPAIMAVGGCVPAALNIRTVR